MNSQALTDTYRERIIAVTGGTGFIGARLLRQLSQTGPKQLRVLARPTSSIDLIKDLAVDVIFAPLEDPRALDRALEGADYVFHLAGLTRAKTKAQLMDVNGVGAGNLAAAVRRSAPRIRRLLHVSSQAAIGPNPPGVDAMGEIQHPAPVTWYGESKLEGEKALVANIGDCPWSIVRPPGVYGPGEKDFLSMFRMVKSRFAPVIGFRPKYYSLVYSEDLVTSMLAVAACPQAVGEAYFAADPHVHSSRDLLREIEAALNKGAWKPPLPEVLVRGLAAANSLVAPFLTKPPLLNLQKLKELLPDRWVVSTEKMQKDVGWVCPTTLKAGIAATAAWYQEKGWL